MRVLLAVDGSPHSQHAVEVVGQLSSVKSLTVVHVVNLPRLTYPALGPDITKDLAMTIEQAMREEGEHILKQAMAHLSYHNAPVSKRLEIGSPADRILTIVEEEKTDLILIGARGLGEVQEVIFGSVSHRVLTHAPCSVCIVKSPVAKLDDILLPIQGEGDEQTAVEFFGNHPFKSTAEITVFNVVPIPRSILRAGVSASETKIQQALESAETFTDHVVGKLKALHYSVIGRVGMGSPAETILEQEGSTNPDLIVMGTHNPSILSRFVLGSVSHTVLHRSTHSVLLIRPTGKEN
ncbi:universal stress protein [Candidatus Nitronereus thalassa]|uniref:Universal stress protein n=1 Tax=Candidatus Nitronereus thalassa TaxID=3020898 RepID=A0ABU3K8G5_9BACT|nr:universal stress protein [Candidatus Nitronereus thalassa]MDT7042628.1 universal stress protein [Candidatus Nitronereus thalassa]